MAPRAYWKGHVRMSLVSFPVQLIPAIDSKERVTFHRVHKQTGQRVRYQSVVPDHGPVESEEIGKGYEYEKGRFVIVEDEEINKLKLESSHTLDIVQFAIWTVLTASGPAVAVAMIVGVGIALVQALTQIQEITLTFVPKIVAIMLVIAFTGPFIGSQISAFTNVIFERIETGF